MSSTTITDPSTARKRRKEILTSSRQNANKRPKSNEEEGPDSKAKTKYQNRYDPEVPMTKEEAAEWRREARRKRNRESAAASRNKVRNRIAELEEEVEDWETKYNDLFQRIGALEYIAFAANPDASAGIDSSSVQAHVSPCSSPATTSRPTVDLQDLSNDIHASSSSENLAALDSLNVPFNLSLPCFETQLRTTSTSDDTASTSANPSIEVGSHNAPSQGSQAADASAPSPDEFHVIEMTSRPA